MIEDWESICFDCKELWKKAGRPTPCKECSIDQSYIGTFASNERILFFYQLVRDQLTLTPMGDPISINFGSINALFDIYDVDTLDRKFYFENLLFCFNLEREVSNDQRKKNKQLGI